MLECLLEALLLALRELDVVLLDLAHSSLDIQLNGMDLLHCILSINLSLINLFQLSSVSSGSRWLPKLTSTSTDLVVPSLETSVLLHGLSVVLWRELAAVAVLILSVEADSVLLVTEGLAGLSLGEYHSGTGLRVLELVEVGLLVPSSQSWALLGVSFETVTGIFLFRLLDGHLLGHLLSLGVLNGLWPDSEISDSLLDSSLCLNLGGLLFNLEHDILRCLGSESKS